MSNFFLADRIKELSRTENTGPIILDGPVNGFSSFADFFASGDVVFYAITNNVDYEVGSGVYKPNGSNRSITRFPLRSSTIDVGPYFVNATSNSGPTNGVNGHFYPLWLTRSAAQSGIGYTDGPYTGVMEHTFDEYPGVTFYMPLEHQGHGTGSHGGISGASYATASSPINFGPGVKEVFVTYPGKTAVFNGYGIDADIREPKDSGIAFWRNEQILNYSSKLLWDDTNNRLGISKTPQYAIDVGGSVAASIVRASGFIDGGSGIRFSGGALTYTSATASGGVQLEPFLRNEKGNGADGVIELSGAVSQYIGFAKQPPGTIFAGPAIDSCMTPPCDPDYPMFRAITIDDIPIAQLTSSGNFVVQRNTGLDSQSNNVSPNNFITGMVALYGGSGQITYDSGIFFDAINNRLMVGGNAAIDSTTHSVHAVKSLFSESGYFNQLIFTNDLIRVGDGAGTNLGNTTQNYYVISIGNGANGSSSGIFDGIAIGRFAGTSSESNSGVVFIGYSAGNDTVNAKLSNVIGYNAGLGASGLTEATAVGKDALYYASGVTSSTLLGNNAARNGISLINVNAVGDSVLREASGIERVVVLGLLGAAYSDVVRNSVLIGDSVAVSGLNLREIVAIGSSAGLKASGQHNIYVGSFAGASLSGFNNIEIVTSGGASSFLGSQASGKINIQETIVADSYAGKVAVGDPPNANPLATFAVHTKSANDAAFIVRHQGSGSSVPYIQLQSGDGTTFYQITNSGDVITSGYMTPSGGLHLPNLSPTRNSGVGGFMLWNNNNTLIWNGSPIGAGGFSSWETSDGITVQAVTDAQRVTFSGVSGVDVKLQGDRTLIFDARQLSGVLQGQITASNYQYYTLASGYNTGNNTPKLMAKDSYLVFSGVNGIDIDFTNLTDGTNSSGIFELSYNPSAFYSLFATNGTLPKSEILDKQTIVVSGVSGVSVGFEYLSGSGFFRVAAPILSGVLQSGINDNRTYLSNQFGPISVSGVSGIAVWASGEFGRLGLGGAKAASGIKFENDTYIMNPSGVGNLFLLNFPSGRIVLRGEASDPNGFYVGGPGSIVIGSGAGVSALGDTDTNVTVVGTQALGGNRQGSRQGMVAIGYRAFASEPLGNTDWSIAIGSRSLSSASGIHNIGIGYSAGEQTSSNSTRISSYNIAFGYEAGKDQDADSLGHNVSIGTNAGAASYSGGFNVAIGNKAGAGINTTLLINTRNTSGIFVGVNAGYGAKDTKNTVCVGPNAGYTASGVNNGIFIGYDAGYGVSGSTVASQQDNPIAVGYGALKNSQDQDQTIAIGNWAGQEASGVDHSIFIGRWAGYRRSSSQSIILSNQSTIPSEGYDSAWCTHSQDKVLDIGHVIQGVMSPANIHIGAELNNSYRTYNELLSATLNISPDADSDAALRLNLYTTNGTTSAQIAGLLKTQTKNSSTIRANLNDIVNKDGYLVVPRATGVTGTSPNKELIADGVSITRAPGVVAVLDQGATKRLCVVVYNTGTGAYEWHATSTLTLL
jgi:hypothetical protein